MEQRNSSFSKVVPLQRSSSAEESDAKKPDAIRHSDVTLHPTSDAVATLRNRFPLQPLTPDSSIDRQPFGSVRRHSFTTPGSASKVEKNLGVRRHSSRMTRSRPLTVSAADKLDDGFFDVFGVLGVPMVVAFVCSAVLMFTQAYVQVHPSEFANKLMNTSEYDDGEFWLLEKADPPTVMAATGMLILFGCGYVLLVVYMLFFRHLAIEDKAIQQNSMLVSPQLEKKRISVDMNTTRKSAARDSTAVTEPDEEITVTEIANGIFITYLEYFKDLAKKLRPHRQQSQANAQEIGDAFSSPENQKSATLTRKNLQRARVIYFRFSDIDGIYHAYYSAMYDLPKLAFQTMTLVTYLYKGFPIAIVAFYCTMLSANWLISFFRFQQKAFDRELIVARLFYIFDLFFAVFSPLLITTYAYYNFTFDREMFRTKEESFPPGEFERTARLFADPAAISIARLSFKHLTLTTGSAIGMKVGLLYLSFYKWRKIIRFLVQSHHKNRRQLTERHSKKHRKHTRYHPFVGVIVFLGIGAGALVYTFVTLVTSTSKCAALVGRCAVISYTWGERDGGCPCLVYIDSLHDPRTYNEWLYPDDATKLLVEAAKEGTLKSVQIINRDLPTLPDVLRRCTSLQQMILIYTETEYFPEWTKELTHMEYFHIEGDFTSRGLKYLPNDMFSHMERLTYLRTGTIPQLPSYPSLAGLEKLESLTIVSGHKLTELPSFDDLRSLRSLNLVENYHIRRLPSLRALTHLKSFNVVYRNEMCCNGYLTGECDQSAPMCRKYTNESAMLCVKDSISKADIAVIEKTEGHICLDLGQDLENAAPTLESTDMACGGVMYRQCKLGNATGICYNVRLQVVMCDTSGNYEAMRRLQIQRNVGAACDPIEEGWLGCPQTRRSR